MEVIPIQPMTLETLKKRADFLYVRGGDKWVTSSFVLQARKQPDLTENSKDDATLIPRFGFTASKKVGNAVQRNRAKRRLREAVRHLGLNKGCKPGNARFDYVLIARHNTLVLSFDEVLNDMRSAFQQIHGKKKQHRRKRSNVKRSTR